MASLNKLSSRLSKWSIDKTRGSRQQPMIVRHNSVKAIVTFACVVFASYIVIAAFWIITGSY
jgi:hypothetical protein